jgi:ribosomal protein S19E (S16A)
MKQLEEAGYVGLVKWQSDEGHETIDKKILTKKGTTDMDRIASQIHKESKKNKK